MPVTPIQFERVGLSFGDNTVLDDVSFSVDKGETKVLLGEAGAGKSVTLKLAIGLLRPESGRVMVLDENVGQLPEEELYTLRRRIGIVFQESALFDSLTVRENVAFRLQEEHRLDAGAIEARVRDCLAMVELEDAIDKMPAELSGGMQRRVSIARAFATEPEIMLYDSPTGGLDPITATNIMEQIIKLRDTRRVTALLVSHRLQDGFLMASHCWDASQNRLRQSPHEFSRTSFLVLHNTHVMFDGSAEELVAAREPYLKHFLQLEDAHA